MSKRILIAAGGTGGHLFPAEQLVEKLQQNSPEVKILFAGHGLSQNPFFAKSKQPFAEIVSAAPKRGNLWQFFISLVRGFWQALSLIRKFQPDVVVGFGSYHTVTVLLAAVFLRKKIVIFEPNCVLGKVNRLFAPFSVKLAIQFPLHVKSRFGDSFFLQQQRKNQVLIKPFPWKNRSDRNMSKQEALLHFGLDSHLPTVLVFGGSQGASFFNDAMPETLSMIPFPVQVIHFTGKGSVLYPDGIKTAIKPFEPRMDLAYLAADVVVCRSGAATIAELIAHQKRALLIPFPLAADNHQFVNAHFFVQKFQEASILSQKNATPDCIAKELIALLQRSGSILTPQEEPRDLLEDLVLNV